MANQLRRFHKGAWLSKRPGKPQVSKPYVHRRGQFSSINQAELTDMMKSKNLVKLGELDGVNGIAMSLGTSLVNGITHLGTNLESSKTSFGSNNICKKSPIKRFFGFVLKAFKETSILLQLASAAILLGFGIKRNGSKEGWQDGSSILIGVFLATLVSSFSNFRQDRHFDSLSKRSIDNIRIYATRGGKRENIRTCDVVVGDVIILNTGDQIPADGLFIDGEDFSVLDESSRTGDSDQIDIDAIRNPFLFSGSKVVRGHARMLVISDVGMNTTWGKMMSGDDFYKQKPTENRLNKLISVIAKISLAATLLDLVIISIRYATGHTKDANGNWGYNGKCVDANEILYSFIRAVTTVAEGLQISVALTHAFSTYRMMNDQILVRSLTGCDTVGSATVICTGKTWTLTTAEMKVAKCYIGFDLIYHDSSDSISARVIQKLSPGVLQSFQQGVGLNTTSRFYNSGTTPGYSGSPTEMAIHSWAVAHLKMDIEKLKKDCTILHEEPFNAEKKRSGVSIKDINDNSVHVHWKGDPWIILGMCSHYYHQNGTKNPISEINKTYFENIIIGMAASSLKCIAFAHKQDGNVNNSLAEEGLTLLGIVGIKDPCRPGVKEAITTCRSAGVEIKMITGDNVYTAKAIATQCGILEGSDVSTIEVIEGEVFRNLTHEQRMERVDSIRVMANSSPSDKVLMLECLRRKGHVVVATFDSTKDAPALREADIGISVGIQQGTGMANEGSDIVILNDGLISVVKVLMWGRCVQNNMQKCIQFQLSSIAVVFVINFIKAASAGGVSCTPIQQLCVNLIIGVLGSLVLSTERPSEDLMHKPPVSRDAPLVTNVMWRNILASSLYQIIILLTFEFKGKSLFNVTEKVKSSIIFNTFVLCQVFNLFNSRKLEKKNIFDGLHKNLLFIEIIGVAIVTQVVLIEFLNKFSDTEKLNGGQWGICVAAAALLWPLGLVVKFIPVPVTPFLSYIQGWIN